MIDKIVNNVKTMLTMVAMPYRHAKGHVLAQVFLYLLMGIVPSLEILVLAKLIDRMFEQSTHGLELIITFACFIVLKSIVWLGGPAIRWNSAMIETGIRKRLEPLVITKIAKIKYEFIEDDTKWDLIDRVLTDIDQKVTEALGNILSLITVMLRVAGVSIVLTRNLWWTGIVFVLLMMPLIHISYNGGIKTYRALVDVSSHIRKHAYYRKVLTGREAAKERALFRFSGSLNEQWSATYNESRKIQFDAMRAYFARMKGSSLVTTTFALLNIWILIEPTVSGYFSIGTFISVVYGLIELTSIMSWKLTNTLRAVFKSKGYIEDIRALFNLEEDAQMSLPALETNQPFEYLEFKEVSFSYPGSDKRVLNSVSFKLEANKHYSLVGPNGAGKSTLIKLMLGLYDAYTGQIKLNGRELKEYSRSELVRFLGVVFQDYYHFPLTIQESILLGEHSEANKVDERRLENTLNRMGLRNFVEELPKGLSTKLGKLDGASAELSGGYWQRLALARVVYSSSEFLVLDEPTSALDPIMESKMYEHFAEASKHRTTLTISHRLGATKSADSILVLEKGHLVDEGSHERLLAKNGLYAKMYNTQKEWYAYE